MDAPGFSSSSLIPPPFRVTLYVATNLFYSFRAMMFTYHQALGNSSCSVGTGNAAITSTCGNAPLADALQMAGDGGHPASEARELPLALFPGPRHRPPFGIEFFADVLIKPDGHDLQDTNKRFALIGHNLRPHRFTGRYRARQA